MPAPGEIRVGLCGDLFPPCVRAGRGLEDGGADLRLQEAKVYMKHNPQKRPEAGLTDQ